jgi:hypothetical protein
VAAHSGQVLTIDGRAHRQVPALKQRMLQPDCSENFTLCHIVIFPFAAQSLMDQCSRLPDAFGA